MAIRKVIQLGHPSLKSRNKKIKNVLSKKTQKLLKDLRDTMYKTGLVGIAAPQIAENHMVFLTHPRNIKLGRKIKKFDKLRVFINPQITFGSKQKIVIYEGCGSVAAPSFIFGPVTRSKEIEVSAKNERGERFSLRCDGLLARVILHEMDHLDGVEFIQKVDNYSKLMHKEHYYKKVRSSAKQKKALKITKVLYKKL